MKVNFKLLTIPILPDVLPSDPTPEQGSTVLTSLGSCFLEHVVSSTAIGLCIRLSVMSVDTPSAPTHLALGSHEPPVPADKAELAGPGVRPGALHHGGLGLVPEAPVAVEVQSVLLI